MLAAELRLDRAEADGRVPIAVSGLHPTEIYHP